MDGDTVHVVTVGLDEEGIHGPGSLTIVAEGPGLSENFSRVDDVLVTEALLDEAAGILDEVLLLLDGSLLLLRLFNRDLRGFSMRGNTGVLADEAGRGHGRVSDLEHGTIRIDTLSFTCLTEIVIGVD